VLETPAHQADIDVMNGDPYSSRVLELAADIPCLGRLEAADASAHKVSRICGSQLTVDLRIREGRIIGLGLEVSACALGQASASIFARAAPGASLEDVREGRDALKAMLQDGAEAPEGRFAALEALAPVAPYRQRHGSILLAFDAAVEAMEAAHAV